MKMEMELAFTMSLCNLLSNATSQKPRKPEKSPKRILTMDRQTTWVSNLQSTIEDRRVLIDGKWLTANLLVIISYVYVLYDQRGRKLVRSGSAQKFGHEYNNS